MQRQIKVNQAANTFFLSTVLLVAVFTCSLLAQSDENASAVDLLPEKIAPINAPFEMPRFKRPAFPDRTFNIKDFGAAEGGKIKVTDAIRKTIEAAAKAGGGKVVIPEGIWLTGPIHLKSNINLYAAEGAEVRFSSHFKDYLPGVFSRHNGVECYKPSALIYANGCKNIAITGKGLFHGYGKDWRGNANRILAPAGGRPGKLVADNVPVKDRLFEGSEGDYLRPAFVQPINCKNVFIEGVTFKYGPQWTIQPTYCENVIVRGVRVVTKGTEEYDGTPNGDGVNPDSCKNVLIEYCDMDTGDDCFAIKSGRAEDGLRVGRPCENIVIRHNQGRRGHGGVVIGSETSGGIRNVFIRNCRFNGTDRGLRFKTARGRGAVIEDIWARDIAMGTIRKEAIIVNTLRYTDRYPAHPVSDRTPTYRNLHFQNITCENSRGTAIRIVGLPEKPMGGLTFENIAIRGGKGIHAQDAGNVKFTNVEVVPDNGPVVLLDECFDITIENANRPKDAHTFIQLIGEKTRNIKMDGADVTAAKIKVVSGKDVPSVATGTISAIRDGLWSDPSIWDADGDGTSDGRIPDGTKDLKVVIGGESLAPSGVTVILDKDVDDFFGVRVYDHSTLVIPTGRTLKLSGREGKFRPDRRNSLVRQTGGTIDISRYFRIDDEDCQYLITGGSVHIGGSEGLRFHEGELIIDDSSATITSISVAGPFRTDNGDGYKKTKFVAHSGGVTPIQCTDVMLDSYSGGALVVDVTDYDYATNGDLVLISYTGTRTGKFPASQVKVIGAKADLVYDDAAKKIKLSNFRP